MSRLNARSESSVASATVFDEAVRHAIQDARDERGVALPEKQVAARMNVPVHRVYEMAQLKRPARGREIALLVRATNCFEPIDQIERDLGRVGVMLPAVTETVTLADSAKLVSEFAEFLQQISTSEPGGFRRSEAAAVRVQAEQAIAQILAVTLHIESVASDAPRMVRR